MATTQELRDGHGKLIGRILIGKDEHSIQDASNRTLGYYNIKSNTTRDSHNRTIGQGNLLSMLLTTKK